MKRVATTVPSTVWIVHTAKCSLIFKSTEQILVSGISLTCVSTFFGRANSRSIEICAYQCGPCRTSCGLFFSHPSGRRRPHVPTFTHAHELPVHSLSMIDDPSVVRHCPAYRVTDRFQRRGGTGGRTVYLFPLLSANCLRLRHLARFV